jgi:hypothetical protein
LTGDGDASPELLKAIFHPCGERRIFVQRPEEDSAHERLEDLYRDLFLLETRIDFATVLAGGNHVRDNPAALFHVVLDDGADAFASEKAGDQCAGQIGAAAGLFSGTMEEVMNRGLDRLLTVVDEGCGFPYFSKLNLSHYAQDVFLALEVIEEGAFAYVRGLRYVFHGDVGKAPLGKEPEGAAEETKARLGGAALTTVHALEMGQIFFGGGFRWYFGSTYVTVAHK